MYHIDPKEAIADHVAAGQRKATDKNTLTEAAHAIIKAPAEKGLSTMVIVGFAQFFEAVTLTTLGMAIYFTYLGGDKPGLYVPLILLAVLISSVLFGLTRVHCIPAYRTMFQQTARVLAVWSVVFALLSVAAFLLKMSDSVSRVWMVSWYATGATALVLFRVSLRALIRHWSREGRLKRRTVIVGGGEDAEILIEAIRESTDGDIDLLGLFDDRIDERSPELVAGCKKLGKISDLVHFAHSTRIDLVIVSMPLSAEKRVLQMLKQLWILPVDIKLSAHMNKLRFRSHAYSYVGDVPVFDIADRPISDWNFVLKLVFDKVVAVGALIALSPVMLIAAIAIKMESKGPILFKQKRHGFNNELIEIYKFRSMYTDLSDEAATKLVTKNDPRVTKVGRWLRKSSIDELPQLVNVLKGELSIVGPRPHALEAKAANKLYHEAVDGYFARHRVKPGITGWAQINGWRGETDTLDKIMQRVNHDLYYIEHWSIFLDIYVLMMTPISLFTRKEGAY